MHPRTEGEVMVGGLTRYEVRKTPTVAAVEFNDNGDRVQIVLNRKVDEVSISFEVATDEGYEWSDPVIIEGGVFIAALRNAGII